MASSRVFRNGGVENQQDVK